VADCGSLRPVLQAYLDGECAPDERHEVEAHLHSCQACLDGITRASWEVGLILLAAPLTPAVPRTRSVTGPSAGFAGRVMDRVRATPRDAAPVETPEAPAPGGRAAPAPPDESPGAPHAVPAEPSGRILRPAPAMAWRTWAGLAATAAVAAAASFILLRGEPRPETPSSRNLEGRGVVVARNGGVLRWKDRTQFDLGLAGSVWIAKDDSSPTLPGEFLHSSAPSSVHMQLPGGGRLTAGPLASLAVGEGDTVALLDGALTATAGPRGPLVVETPAGRVETKGAVEVSVRTVSDTRTGQAWLGAWTSAGAPGGAPAAPAPAATVAVFAREGSVEVAASGPVRNSLERHTLHRGQALLVVDAKVFTFGAVDDDAPPEHASALAGLPVPPGSLFLKAPPAAPAPPPPPPGGIGASGPVRNSLERAMAEVTGDPGTRAYALSVYDGVGGAEAVAAAAKAVEDPAVLVRSTAVRVLALNASADRPKALAALRLLAKDVDEGVAVFAIRALMALADRGALPILQNMVVDDDAPPESGAAPVSVQVAAFQALVHFGDTSRFAAAASRLTRLDTSREPGATLQQTVATVIQRLPAEKVRELLADPRPALRAAALEASMDVEAARTALGDASPAVQMAAARVLLTRQAAPDLEVFRPLVERDTLARRDFLQILQSVSRPTGLPPVPDWLREAAARQLSDPASRETDVRSAAFLLRQAPPPGLFEGLLARGTTAQKLGIIADGDPAPGLLLAALADPDPLVVEKVASRLQVLAALPESRLATPILEEALRAFAPRSLRQAQFKALALGIVGRDRTSAAAVATLVGMAQSSLVQDRRAAPYGLGPLGARAEAAAALEALLQDGDREAAENAGDQFLRAARRPGWAGRPPAEIFSLASPHAVVRAQAALAARNAGAAGATEALVRELAAGGSAARLRILERLEAFGRPLDAAEPSLLRDPEPAVRLRSLLVLEGAGRDAAARSLAADPAFWVRATALALLGKSGDGASLEGLRTLVGDQVSAGLRVDPLLAGLDPEAEALADAVLASARRALSFPGPTLRPVDASLAYESQDLANRSNQRRLCAQLRSAPDAALRAAAAAGLREAPAPDAVPALVRAMDPAAEAEPLVREAAAESLNRLLGFDPKPDAKSWWEAHRGGFVAEQDLEVLARDAR
jgi:hypothetical protein